MSDLIVSLAALKTFYDEAQNPLDHYGDAILASIESRPGKYSLNELQKAVKEKFDIDIPSSMVIKIIKRLGNNKLFDYGEESLKQDPENKIIALTEDGSNKIITLNSNIRKAERQESALLKALKEYLERDSQDLSIEELRNQLEDFIQNNPFVATSVLAGEALTDSLSENHKNIRGFFEYVETSDQSLFEYLSNSLLGKIIASNLLEKEASISLKKVTFYIDTNIILSLLELHRDHINNMAQDTVNLIKRNKGNVKIFQHTLEETIDFFRTYIEQYPEIPIIKGINVDNTYVRMKNEKGYGILKTQELITELQSQDGRRPVALEKLGIEREKSKELSDNPTFDRFDYHEFIAYKKERKEKEGRNPNEYGIDKDCLSIELIRKIRRENRYSYALHMASAIFLSSDQTLVRFAKEQSEGNHDDNTVPEAFTPGQLTGILWLQDVNADPHTDIHKFMSRNIARGAIVKSHTWNYFLMKFNELKNGEKVEPEKVIGLLSSQHLKAILKENNKNKIDDYFSDANIKKETNRIEGMEEKLGTATDEIEVLKQDNKQKDKRLAESYVQQKKYLEETVEKGAKREIFIVAVLGSVIAVVIWHWMIDIYPGIEWIAGALGSILVFLLGYFRWNASSKKSKIEKQLKRIKEIDV